MNREFPRSFESLKDIFDFTDRFFAREAIEPRHHFAVNFAVEELFTNMVKYNADGPAEILLSLKAIDRGVHVSLVDFDTDPFDAVIMDLTIPGGMGGREAIQHLRRIDPEVRAIVSSGYSEDPVMADHRRYGFVDVVAKPYDIGDLSRVLDRVVGRSGA